jgi:hypothetical protein
MRQHDDHVRVGRSPGLDWVQTCVLRAAGDEAMYLWDRRLTLDGVAARLAQATSISRKQIEDSLVALDAHGYLYADDDPHNPEIVLHLTEKGLDEYCYRFVGGVDSIRQEIFKLVCQEVGIDVHEIASKTAQSGLLVEYILDVAQRMALLRVSKQGQYIVVTAVMPQLRRLISGAA